jgi:hypothetical protein
MSRSVVVVVNLGGAWRRYLFTDAFAGLGDYIADS